MWKCLIIKTALITISKWANTKSGLKLFPTLRRSWRKAVTAAVYAKSDQSSSRTFNVPSTAQGHFSTTKQPASQSPSLQSLQNESAARVNHSAQTDHSLFTQVGDDPPVRVWHSEPLAVPRADVDVDWAEVVVLLVTWTTLYSQNVTISFKQNVVFVFVGVFCLHGLKKQEQAAYNTYTKIQDKMDPQY